MVKGPITPADKDAVSPIASILSAHAGAQQARHHAIWAFDGRLAQVARTTREPAIGQMRLAWWNDVIDDADGVKGQGEPVIDALRATGAIAAPGMVSVIDGWEILTVEPELDEAALDAYAIGRGGGMFQALAGVEDAPDWLTQAGQLWALWDLSGHVGDEALSKAALKQADALISGATPHSWPKAWKPMRMAFTIARQDVMAGRGAPVGMPRGLAWRLLRIGLIGR